MITLQGLDGAGTAANSITLEDAAISARVFGGTADTPAARIGITADSLLFTNEGFPNARGAGAATLVTTGLGAAPAGNIALNINTFRVNVNTDGTPIKDAGRVFINSPSVLHDTRAGPAGTINISGLRPEAIDPARLVNLYNAQFSTSVEGGTAHLAPGSITITADTVNVSGGTQIFSSTLSPAPAGNIDLHVNTLRTNLNPDGTPVEPAVDPRSPRIVSFSSSSSMPDDTAGRAGTVTISGPRPETTDAATIVVLRNARISTAMGTGGTADTAPSGISITADSGVLTADSTGRNSRAGIFAASAGAAPAGNIAFNVSNLSADNVPISSSSTNANANATGNAGSITIQGVAGTGSLATSVGLTDTKITTEANNGAGGSIALASATDITLVDSTISATVSGGRQPGGNITLSTGEQTLLANGSLIAARSHGLGDAGNIIINAGNRFVSTDSAVTTQASQASGGNISIVAGDMVRMSKSQLNASVAGNELTTGGSISIDPQFVILQNSQILANATAGQGGNINVITSAFLSDPNSRVSASSETGISGSVDIRAPVQNLSGTLVPLTQTYLQAVALLAQRCAARFPDGKFSTFVQSGRDGLPVEPGGFLATPLHMVRTGGTGNTTEEPASSYLGRDSTRALVWGRGCAD
jgi:hypothetical protein